jgi:DNA mismatch endonuclease Vsr
MTVDKLKTMVLRFGQRSSHSMGIGIFGLGLNRALFKLGKVSHLTTDTGKQRAELILNTEDYLKSDDWNLPAAEFMSSGKAGTLIEITRLPEDIASIFADGDWVEEYRADVGRRYGRFIQKGLVIEINGVVVPDGEVLIRKDSPFPEEYKFYKKDDVTIHIRSGQHNDHRFSAEADYDKARNARLTDQFGWTVLCNDRAVVVSDKTLKTGWDTRFHTEFYGFVGVVSFDADDPAKLPWDTTKFDIDMNNHVYQTALVTMRKFVEKWRSHGGRAKLAKRKGERLLPSPNIPIHPGVVPDSRSKPTLTEVKPTKGSMTPKTKKSPTIKTDHNQFGTVLPDDVDELNCFDKHLALVHEAKKLDLNILAYSGMALIRCLFETTVVTYFERHGKLADLKQFVIDTRKKNGQEIKNEKNVVPDLEEMIAFMENNPDIWGAVKQNHVRHSLRKLAEKKKLLNSAIHNPWQAINRSEAFSIRDEVLAVLRHLYRNLTPHSSSNRAMVDHVSPERRAEIMRAVRGKDTAPELLVRKAAHKLGLRFRLHAQFLPGKPDLVFRKWRTVVFVNGCFWHRHSGCKKASTRKQMLLSGKRNFRITSDAMKPIIGN